MAVLLGTSGAWFSVQRPLNSVDLYPASPDDLVAMLPQLEERCDKADQYARKAYNAETDRIKNVVSASVLKSNSLLEQFEELHAQERAALQLQMEIPRGKGIIASIVRYLKRTSLIKALQAIETQQRSDRNRVHNLRYVAENAFDYHIRSEYDCLENYKFYFQNRYLVAAEAKESPEYAGALAELEVLEALAKLPNTYYVLADVNLASGQWLQFNGNSLRTAQLDCCVVGPAGCFVIEVKRWSRAFVEDAYYHDPFDQVGRASYLCYKVLSSRGIKTRVRSIIATRSSLPDKPDNSKTKILAPHRIVGYIQNFPQQVDETDVANIVEILQDYM